MRTNQWNDAESVDNSGTMSTSTVATSITNVAIAPSDSTAMSFIGPAAVAD